MALRQSFVSWLGFGPCTSSQPGWAVTKARCQKAQRTIGDQKQVPERIRGWKWSLFVQPEVYEAVRQCIWQLIGWIRIGGHKILTAYWLQGGVLQMAPSISARLAFSNSNRQIKIALNLERTCHSFNHIDCTPGGMKWGVSAHKWL